MPRSIGSEDDDEPVDVLPELPEPEGLGLVAVVFGGIGAIIAGRQLWRFRHPPADRRAWWTDHMIGMLSSYIAIVTAFSVVNFSFLPPIARWRG